MTIATDILARIADMPHRSTRIQILNQCRAAYVGVDDGFTERFTLPDGSVLVYDHTANPGYEFRAD